MNSASSVMIFNPNTKKMNILNPIAIGRPFKAMALVTGFLLMSIMNPLFAKENPGKKSKEDKKAKIEELRKKFYNEKLSLTEAEQKAFWPVYDEYKQKEKALRDSFRAKYKPNDVIFMDDKQAEAYLNAVIKLNDDQNNLYKEYVGKMKAVIPVKKVAMLPMVEKEFRKQMFKKAKNKKGGHPGPKPDAKPDND